MNATLDYSELKYKIIQTREQYFEYCNVLENLYKVKDLSVNHKEEIALLNLLINTWNKKQASFPELDPVELLKVLMDQHKLTVTDLHRLFSVHKSIISEILHYKRGFPKTFIRQLAEHFKLSQEAFNKEYVLRVVPDEPQCAYPADSKLVASAV